MRTPSLALYTALPLFAIATAAQANDELTITVVPTDDGPDVATQNQNVVAQEVAAIAIPVEPAPLPETPEFTPAPEPTKSLDLDVFASHGELPTEQGEPLLAAVVESETTDAVTIAAIATKTPKPAPTIVVAEAAVEELEAPVNAIAPQPPTPESLQRAEPAMVESPAVEIIAEPPVAASVTEIPVIESPVFEPTVAETSTAELPAFERLAVAPTASELTPTAIHEPEFAEDVTFAANAPTDCTSHLPRASAIGESVLVAQAFPTGCYEPEEVAPIELPKKRELTASPALSIYIPVGYGADQNTAFLSTNYQSAARPDADGSTFNGGVGVGLGNAAESVGVELSYALANNDNFGEGGLNVKLHRQLPDDWAIAAGWNGLLNIGRNDFEHSKYGVVTKVLRLRPSLSDPLSRLSITAGVGDNQFRSNGAVQAGDNNINLFGNMALRVARPVSLITEWTGQDLGLGLSIAPFKRVPLTITPAVRDLVTTNGRATRFVLGVGTAIQF